MPRPPSPRCLWLALLTLVASYSTAAENLRDQAALLFRPPLAQRAALSVQGDHVAFSRPKRDGLYVEIVHIPSSQTTATLLADTARPVLHSKETDSGGLRFLRWAKTGRLVFAPEIQVLPASPYPNPQGGAMPNPGGPILIGDIFSIGPNGEDPRTLLDSRELARTIENPFPNPEAEPRPVIIKYRTAEILGLALNSEDDLLVESRGFRSGPMLQFTELIRVNASSGKQKVVSDDTPFSTYVYDLRGNRRLSFTTTARTGSLEVQVRGKEERAKWIPFRERFPAAKTVSFQFTAANYFGERMVPLGFGVDPDHLLVASNIGRDTYSVHIANTATGTIEPTGIVAPSPDLITLEPDKGAAGLVLDPHTGKPSGLRLATGPRPVLWIDPEIAALEKAVGEKLPGKIVEILEWSFLRAHFLIKVSDGSDPGRLYFYWRREGKLLEIAQAAPWLTREVVHKTEPFEVPTRDGARVSGHLTLPNKTRVPVPPLIVIFSAGFPGAPHAAFDPEAHMLAGMGFIVARINQRGTTGLGRAHLHGRPAAVDTQALGDALSTLDWIGSHHRFDRKRIVVLGHGYGGHLALRALQTVPEVFRCAVAFDAPVDLHTWIPDDISAPLQQTARRRLLEARVGNVQKASVIDGAEKLTKPVMLIAEGRHDPVYRANGSLLRKLRSLGRSVEWVETHEDFKLGLPQARAEVYEKLQAFLYQHVYDFDVKVGPVTEVGKENPVP